MSVRKTLEKLKNQGRAGFIPYITAGDPTIAATETFVRALVDTGADIIELGVPFSDPMADGPVNQRSAERALKNNVSLRDVLALVGRLRKSGVETPLVLFTYFNPIFVLGIEEFSRQAALAGVDAVLALDLPVEEAEEYRKLMAKAGVETIFLATPTTPEARLRKIDEATTGFIYYVSRTGVTGAQSRLSDTLAEELSRVRKAVRSPLAVGFGISAPEQARTVAGLSDAVVVGSAIVQLIEDEPDPAKACRAVQEFVGGLVAAIREK